MSREGHMERTATEPRQPALHKVKIQHIDQVNPSIRVVRLQVVAGPIRFLPGQFLDVLLPGIAKEGGFTPTSPPSRATDADGYIELAVQRAPENPAAEFFWRGPATPTSTSDDGDDDEKDGSIVGTELHVRVGGAFVYPPPGVTVSLPSQLRRIVFVAGGVGVNPLVCMATHLAEQAREAARLEVRFLYSVRAGAAEDGAGDDGEGGWGETRHRILFLERLAMLFAKERLRGRLDLFLTSGAAPADGNGVVSCNDVDVPFKRRRINRADLVEAVGPDRRSAVVYVCGVPAMTDEFVRELTAPIDGGGVGMEPHRVLSEKWW